MSTRPLCIRTEQVPPRPWRNGGGVTRELLAWPDASQWRVRLSVANIDSDGPFSAFPGVERWFAVLEGAGVELVIDGQAQQVRCGDTPVRFGGEAAVECRLLDGPTRDLNLMLQGGIGGAMRIVTDGARWNPPPGHACGLYSLVAGQCDTEDESRAWPAPIHEVAVHELLWFEQAPKTLSFSCRGHDRLLQVVGYWLVAGVQA